MVAGLPRGAQQPGNQKSETRNQKPETRNQKPETRNQKSETRNLETQKPSNPETQQPRNPATHHDRLRPQDRPLHRDSSRSAADRFLRDSFGELHGQRRTS